MLLTKEQAEHIAQALATMNNLNVPYFKTVITGTGRLPHDFLIFEWNQHREENEVHVLLGNLAGDSGLRRRGYPTVTPGRNVGAHDHEYYANQAAFLDAYGVY